MRKFFTSDFHFNSLNTLQRENRPFRDVYAMNNAFIRTCNSRAKVDEGDVVIHVGDLNTDGNDHGVMGGRVPLKNLLRQIEPQFLSLEGNHDANRSNRVKSIGVALTTRIGQYMATVSHFPSNNARCAVTAFAPCNDKPFHLHLCGHVHGAWKWMFDAERNVLNVNVGVDVWNYQIVSEDELAGFVDRLSHQTCCFQSRPHIMPYLGVFLNRG